MTRTKNTIGFKDKSEETEDEAIRTMSASVQEMKPVACVAKIRFKDTGHSFDYYNDEFYLEPGDKVFVSGKFYGKLGLVESITTHFRIDKTKYRKVIGRPNLHISGSFIHVNDKMISFDTDFDPERFAAVIIPPPDPESEEKEKIICGEGWSVGFENFEESESVNPDKIKPGFDYCTEGNVIYFSMKNSKGTAFIRGRHIYKAEFSFDGETVSDLFCTCPFNDDCLCKHEMAVLITLRMLMDRPEFEGKHNFVAFDSEFFWNYVSAEAGEITLK
ncbi:MAG: hypothetical protein IKH65_08150 [Clostridia bacterium]|nr:hypothetical protein [Clostridia bacterium]MBR6940762.1 hypothetical protein [Clostridia bacterium]